MRMRALLIGPFLLMFSAVIPALAQPSVVGTNPADGAQGVAGPVVTVGVKFSEPMKSSFSLVVADAAPFPEPVGDPWFEDPTTFYFQARVEPAKAYAIGLNSPTRPGFVSAAGQPLAPVVFGFRTADSFTGARAAAGDAPAVVATTPADGATDVLGPEVTIHVRFSAPVKMNSWSLVPADGGEEPRYVGDPWFSDNLSFAVKARVEPGTRYALGLNSQSKTGFLSADGERAARPFVLRFETAATFANAAAPRLLQWAATPPVAAEEEGADGPGAEEVVAIRSASDPLTRRVRFGTEWVDGETQERVTATEHSFDYSTAAGNRGAFSQTTTTTVALQALATDRGNPLTVRGKATNFQVTQPDPATGQLQTLTPPLPTFVMEATGQAGNWAAQAIGADVDQALLNGFAADIAVGSPFTTADLTPLGGAWELQGTHLETALALLTSEDVPEGQVTCRFAELSELEGQRVATIAHTWKVRFGFQGLKVDAEGQGSSLYAIDARRFLRHTLELACNVPQQVGPSGDTFTATGTLKVSQTMKYYPPGQFPQLAALLGPQSGPGYVRGESAKYAALSLAGASTRQFKEGMAALSDVFGSPTSPQGGATSPTQPTAGGFPAGGGFPTTGGGVAPAGGGFPTTGGGVAPAGGGFPTTGGGGFPTGGGAAAPAGGGFPTGGGGFPTGGGAAAPAGGGFPTTGGGFPTGGGAAAPAGGGFPTTGGGVAPAGGGFPTTGGGFPTGGGAAAPGGGGFPTGGFGAGMPGGVPGAGLAAGIPPELPGVWFMQTAEVSILLMLAPTGQYSLMINMGMYMQQEEGVFTATGDTITFTQALGGTQTPCRYRLVNPSVMEITPPNGITILLMRQGQPMFPVG